MGPRNSSSANGLKSGISEINCLSPPRYDIAPSFACTYYTRTDVIKQYTTDYRLRDKTVAQRILYTGNNAKSLHMSVEASLKKLRTTYIDLLYLHWWDWDTGVEEVMKSLHTLVLQGKVIYLVSSSTIHYCDG